MIKIFAFFGFFFSLILFLRVVKADTAPLEVQTQGENLKDELFEQYKQSLAQGKLKTKLEYNKIIEYFTTLSNQDDAEAQFELAKIYIAGKVGIKDTKKALELFNKSAENGNADALYELSKIYGAGKGVIRNAKKALEFLNKSAEKGNTVALYEVSKLYETGKGVTKDKEKAFEFLNKSAEKGNVDALYKLGVFYKTKGITKDLDKALDYLTKAVELGHKKAQLELDNIATEFKNEFSQQHELVYKGNTQAAFNVANFYAEGKGVEQSDDRAEFYYKKAADANHLEAFGKFYEFNDKIYISKYYKRLASYKELESNNKLATKGSYAALYSLGVYYMEEEQDEKKALEYFKMASKKVKKSFLNTTSCIVKPFFMIRNWQMKVMLMLNVE